MDRGPGRYRCVTYLKAWTHGARDWADDHVRNCPFCRPIAYGDGHRFIGTIHEEAERLRTERRQKRLRRRRAFLGATAAGVLAITAGVMWPGGGETRAKPSNGDPVQPNTELRLKDLDRQYIASGRASIEKIMTTGTTEQVELTLFWISNREHKSLYDIVAQSLSDPRVEVRMAAIAELASFSKTDSTPFMPEIKAQLLVEQDEEVIASLKALGAFIRQP